MQGCFKKPNFVVPVLVGAVLFVLYGLILQWLIKLERMHPACECARDWKRSFIIGWIFFILVSQVVSVSLLLSINCDQGKVAGAMTRFLPWYLIYEVLVLGGAIAFVVIALKYLKQLKDAKCECALAGNRDEILKAIAYIQMAILILAGVLVVFAVVFGVIAARKYMAN